MDLLFDSDTNTIRYPDGVEEQITTYLTRQEKFEALKAMQHELERLKILHQNPCCASENELRETTEEVWQSMTKLWSKVV